MDSHIDSGTSKPKKRVNLVTLETNLVKRNKRPKARNAEVAKAFNTIRNNHRTKCFKKTSCEIIDLDSEENHNNKNVVIDVDSIQDEVINVEEYQSDVMIVDYVDTGKTTTDITGLVDSETIDITLESSQNDIDKGNKLLVPHREDAYGTFKSDDISSLTNKSLDANATQPDVKIEIECLEKKIAHWQKLLLLNEQQEVTDDGEAYLLSAQYKAMIVDLYKQLCQLTGVNKSIVKKCKVRLKVLEGHPVGPTKKLEEHLNNNLDETGCAIFPDILDVIKCVLHAVEEDGLGWNRQQVMNEATSLFTQCGKAIQKKRQKREWKDLLHQMKKEDCDVDPADNDPVLRAKLEAHRQDAVKKENALLQRYTKLHQQRLANKNKNKLRSHPNTEKSVISSISNNEPKETARLCENINPDDNILADENKNINNYTAGCNNSVVSTTEICTVTDRTPKVKVKTEPEDINDLLKQFGDNYTTQVVDIEDPFLVIEISDSSDDSEDEGDKGSCSSEDESDDSSKSSNLQVLSSSDSLDGSTSDNGS